MSVKAYKMPREFIARRLHSLFGFWIVLFLVEHLFTNSQAALLLGENGKGFVRAVNFIKNLPYLPVIEVVLLGVPILMHGLWGIKYIFSAKSNAFNNNKAMPILKYGRNRAFSWQRLASWVLLVGLISHVAYMRFYRDPGEAKVGDRKAFFMKVSMDKGLYSVADKLDARLWSAKAIKEYGESLDRLTLESSITNTEAQQFSRSAKDKEQKRLAEQYKLDVYNALKRQKLGSGEVIAQTKDFGTAELLMVRDTFKSITNCILYTIFVAAAVFHGFNGLWTFLISWGIVLRMRSQSRAVNWCITFMVAVGFLGLAAIWGTYFLNLRN